MQASAIVFQAPLQLSVRRLPLRPSAPDDLEIDVLYSGISTGTERLLWDGSMPPFPGMGYPLVPGYESVGRVVTAVDKERLAVAKALDYVRQIRKTPIVVNDARFFYANRCIIPYINEGIRMVAEGVEHLSQEAFLRQQGCQRTTHLTIAACDQDLHARMFTRKFQA